MRHNRKIREDTMDLLNVYATILDKCNNRTATNFLITRVYRALSRSFPKRKETDFPTMDKDVQIVYLINYIQEKKWPYAFLYASSLYNMVQNETKINDIRLDGMNTLKGPRWFDAVGLLLAVIGIIIYMYEYM